MRVPLGELKRKQEAVDGEASLPFRGGPQTVPRAPSGIRDYPAGTGTSTEKRKLEKIMAEPSSAVHRGSSLLAVSPGIELDLRGQRPEDALDLLDRYLEKAYMTGLPFVRIIHGKGTGKLRQEVRAALKDHPHVLSFEEGGDKEGGSGVTVAKLATE